MNTVDDFFPRNRKYGVDQCIKRIQICQITYNQITGNEKWAAWGHSAQNQI